MGTWDPGNFAPRLLFGLRCVPFLLWRCQQLFRWLDRRWMPKRNNICPRLTFWPFNSACFVDGWLILLFECQLLYPSPDVDGDFGYMCIHYTCSDDSPLAFSSTCLNILKVQKSPRAQCPSPAEKPAQFPHSLNSRRVSLNSPKRGEDELRLGSATLLS